MILSFSVKLLRPDFSFRISLKSSDGFFLGLDKSFCNLKAVISRETVLRKQICLGIKFISGNFGINYHFILQNYFL